MSAEQEICDSKISSAMLSDLHEIMKLVLQKNKHIEQDIPGTEKAVEAIISFYLTNRKQFEALLCIHSDATSKEASEDEAFWEEDTRCRVGKSSTETENEDWDEEISVVCPPEPNNHLVEDWPEDMCVGRPSYSAIVIQETNLEEEVTSLELIEYVPDPGYWIEWQVQRKEQTKRYVQKLCNQAETDLIAGEKLDHSVTNSQAILCVQQSVEKYLKATWLSGSCSADTTMITRDFKTHDLNYLAETVAKLMEEKLKIPSEDEEDYESQRAESTSVRDISELEIIAKKLEQLGQRTDDLRPLCVRTRYSKSELTETSIEQTPYEIFTDLDVQQALPFAKEIKQICLDYIQVFNSY